MTVPADVAALVRLGLLSVEEVRPGLFRRSRLPSRTPSCNGEQPTHDHETEETDTQ